MMTNEHSEHSIYDHIYFRFQNLKLLLGKAKSRDRILGYISTEVLHKIFRIVKFLRKLISCKVAKWCKKMVLVSNSSRVSGSILSSS